MYTNRLIVTAIARSYVYKYFRKVLLKNKRKIFFHSCSNKYHVYICEVFIITLYIFVLWFLLDIVTYIWLWSLMRYKCVQWSIFWGKYRKHEWQLTFVILDIPLQNSVWSNNELCNFFLHFSRKSHNFFFT